MPLISDYNGRDVRLVRNTYRHWKDGKNCSSFLLDFEDRHLLTCGYVDRV